MDYHKFFKEYSNSILSLLNKVDTNLINQSVELIKKVKNNNNKIYIVGNGGSSSIASHVSVDFAKVARIPSSTFNNSNLITCFANDYGYENWVTEAIKAYCNNNDLFNSEIENTQCPTAFLKHKYNLEVENPYDKIIQAMGENFSKLNCAQQFGYLAHYTWPSGMPEQALQQFSKLHESNYIPTLLYFGECFLYGNAKNKPFQQNISRGLEMAVFCVFNHPIEDW